MKITERDLMVGDWVHNEVPCYVTAIYPNGTMDCQGDGWAISTDRVDPIPITSEVLEKNGWSYNNEDAKYAAGTWVGNGLMLQENGVGYRIVVVSDYDDEDTNDTQFVITYIHQLQHALRLAGIDKEIKL